jgi:hypothetical protein
MVAQAGQQPLLAKAQEHLAQEESALGSALVLVLV